jgi:hypothetical protein
MERAREDDFEVIDMEKDLIRPTGQFTHPGFTLFPPTKKEKVFIKQAKWIVHKQPTNNEEVESFYIGPIHFNHSGRGLGFYFDKKKNETMAKRIKEGLLDILFQHFDPLLSAPSRESIRNGNHTFSSVIRRSIISGQNGACYCLRHPDSTLSFDKSIACEVFVNPSLLANVLNPKEREIAEVAFVHTFKKQDVQRTHSIQTLTLSLKSMKRGFYVTFWRVPQKCKKKVNDSFQLNFVGPSGKKENEFLCCFGSCI